ncbi:MAG: hypothetical protein LBP40_05340 [Campylobacteraceae bacterium]|jgi:hypothetical protein|nr:hypothetical protein [Campylobacteraceae bacterium]
MNKTDNFFSLISLLLGLCANLIFYTPFVYYLVKIKNKESDSIEFTSFIFNYDIFLVHSVAIIIAFAAFLLGIFALFKKRSYCTLGALIVSISVIAPYLSEYEKIFTALFL